MTARPPRRWFVPEVVQTSAMDCGPATLKSLLAGFRIPVSYGRIREICHTSVDGTSIDTLEDLANDLGLESEQLLLPVEHVLDSALGALPAIVVTRLPSGLTHFVVAWARVGPFIQVMDPGRGRQFMRAAALARDLYVHESPLPTEGVRDFVQTPAFLDPLRRRCAALGVRAARALVDEAAASGWRALAGVDAAARATAALVREGALRSSQRPAAFAALYASARGPDPHALIPRELWSFLPTDSPDQVLARGAIALKANGKTPEPSLAASGLRESARRDAGGAFQTFKLLLKDYKTIKLLPLILGLLSVGAGTVLEALLLRGAFDIGQRLATFGQRVAAGLALVVLFLAFLFLDLPMARSLAALGRRLELGLRRTFLRKLPRLGDAYFQSRPISAMAEIAHLLHWVRLLPPQAGQLLRCAAELTATLAGLAWLHPPSTPLVLLAGVFMFAFPFLTQPLLIERDMRMRGHAGSLARFYLDALLGAQAIRAHTAEPAIASEHGGRLREWARASLSLCQTQVAMDLVSGMIGFGFSAWLVADFLRGASGTGWALLFVYWSFFLPLLGQELAFLVQQYPQHRNITLRLLEPVGAADAPSDALPDGEAPPADPQGVALALARVVVEAGGHPILRVEELRLGAGEHVAIVGASGAGKSSLVGLLLGFHVASEGEVSADGLPLEGACLGRLRRDTVWVDPTVQLWNASLLDNVRFGADPAKVSAAMEAAQIEEILGRLPMGLQTPLGAAGGMLSGGEGQRVRLARGLARTAPRLVILDEAFNGLERPRRQALLDAARRRFARATLLCITHDLAETRGFARVLVLEGGAVVEDGRPEALLARPGSRYAALQAAETQAQRRLSDPTWRRLRVRDGQARMEDGE